MKRGTIGAAVVAAGCLAGASVMAGQCGYENCWGAVGIGPDGAVGWAHSHPSESAAYDAAQDGCGWDCTQVQTFYNTCGAMAVGATGGWGWGVADTRSAAESTAMNYCIDNDYDCAPVVYACSH